ncbi:MAG TPA: cytidylate kinase-like family protein [Verrucomicrobiae bacterium]|nr:cytidylate kinase-like family protein [Verrucomicrobiae bacterium]
MNSYCWPTTDLEARIAAHVHAWERATQPERPPPAETLPFVTINREFGCDALQIATKLAETLNTRCDPSVPWVAYDRELIDRVALELRLRREVVESLDDARRNEMSELFDTLLNRRVTEAAIMRKRAEVICSLAIHGHSILVGRGSHLLTKNFQTGLHVHLIAPREWRVHRIAAIRNVSASRAERFVADEEKKRAQFLRTYFLNDPERPFLYDLVVNVAGFDPLEVAEIILAAALTPRFQRASRR